MHWIFKKLLTVFLVITFLMENKNVLCTYSCTQYAFT
jgi:hypothetical protein